MRKLLWIAAAVCGCGAIAVYVSAQVPKEKKGYEYLSAVGKEMAAEKKDAPAEYQNAIDMVNAGNEALKNKNDASAYCLFGEALYKLNEISSKYPNWNKETLEKQVQNIKAVTAKLNAVTCKILDQMKESDFRLETWQRQALILGKLDRILERLDDLENKYWDKDDKYIKDIRQILFKNRS
ncbi:MAG: hypothetical protein NT045_05960 [Candidatus Aureabacteria bacterium]|nr:hypothetical protein [Candidatus Auribacterota bacterium]